MKLKINQKYSFLSFKVAIIISIQLHPKIAYSISKNYIVPKYMTANLNTSTNSSLVAHFYRGLHEKHYSYAVKVPAQNVIYHNGGRLSL